MPEKLLLAAGVFEQELDRLWHAAAPKHRTVICVGIDDKQDFWMIDVRALQIRSENLRHRYHAGLYFRPCEPPGGEPLLNIWEV